MSADVLSLLVGLGCFAAHAALSLVLLRLPGWLSPVARHAGSAAITHVAGVALGAWWGGPIVYWPVAAVSGFGAVCWLFAFSAVYKSVSLRILTELANAPDHALPFDVITAEYVLPQFRDRTDVLQTMGCAKLAGEAFTVTPKGEATAARIAAVQWVCGITNSGLYSDSELPIAMNAQMEFGKHPPPAAAPRPPPQGGR